MGAIEQPAPPRCDRPDCGDPRHCQACGVHHVVPSMADWCRETKGAGSVTSV